VNNCPNTVLAWDAQSHSDYQPELFSEINYFLNGWREYMIIDDGGTGQPVKTGFHKKQW